MYNFLKKQFMSKNSTNRFKRLRQITLLSSLLTFSSLSGSNLTFGETESINAASDYKTNSANTITSGSSITIPMSYPSTNYQLQGDVGIDVVLSSPLTLYKTSYFTAKTAGSNILTITDSNAISTPISIQGQKSASELLVDLVLSSGSGIASSTFNLALNGATFTSEFGNLSSIRLVNAGDAFSLKSSSAFKGGAGTPIFNVALEKSKTDTPYAAHARALKLQGNTADDQVIIFGADSQAFSLLATTPETSLEVDRLNFSTATRNITTANIVGGEIKLQSAVINNIHFSPTCYYYFSGIPNSIVDFDIAASAGGDTYYLKNLNVDKVGLGIFNNTSGTATLESKARTAVKMTLDTVSPDKITVGGVILPNNGGNTLGTTSAIAFNATSTILELTKAPLDTKDNMFDLSKSYDNAGNELSGVIKDSGGIDLMAKYDLGNYTFAKFAVKANAGITLDKNTTVKYGDQFPTSFNYDLADKGAVMENLTLDVKANSVGSFGIFNDGTSNVQVGIKNLTIKGPISDLNNMNFVIGNNDTAIPSYEGTAKISGSLILDGYITKPEQNIDSSMNTVRVDMFGNKINVGDSSTLFSASIKAGYTNPVAKLAFYSTALVGSGTTPPLPNATYFFADDQEAGLDITISGKSVSNSADLSSIIISGTELTVPALIIKPKVPTENQLNKIELLGSHTYDHVDVSGVTIAQTSAGDVTFNNAIYATTGNALSYAAIKRSAATGKTFKTPYHRMVNGGIEAIREKTTAGLALPLFDLSNLGTMVPSIADNVVTVKNIGNLIGKSTNDVFYNFSAKLPNLGTADLSGKSHGFKTVNLDFATDDAKVVVKDIYTGSYVDQSGVTVLETAGDINLTAGNATGQTASVNLEFTDKTNTIVGKLKVDDAKIKEIIIFPTDLGNSVNIFKGGLFNKLGTPAPNINLKLMNPATSTNSTTYNLSGDYRLGNAKSLEVSDNVSLVLVDAKIGAVDGFFNDVKFNNTASSNISLNNSNISNTFINNTAIIKFYTGTNTNNEFKNVIGLNNSFINSINLKKRSITTFELNDDIEKALTNPNISTFLFDIPVDGKAYKVATLGADINSNTGEYTAFKIDSATGKNLIYKIKELKSDHQNSTTFQLEPFGKIELSGNGTLLLGVQNVELDANYVSHDLSLDLNLVGSKDKNPTAIITTETKKINTLKSFSNTTGNKVASTFENPIGNLVFTNCQAYGEAITTGGYLENATILGVDTTTSYEFNGINVKNLNLYLKMVGQDTVDVSGYDNTYTNNDTPIVIRHDITDYSLLDENSTNEFFKNHIKPSMYIVEKNTLFANTTPVTPTIITSYTLDTAITGSKRIIYTGKFSTIAADGNRQNKFKGTVVAGTNGSYESVDNLYVGYTQSLNVDALQFGKNDNVHAYLGSSSDIKALSTLSSIANAQDRYIHLSAKENTANNYVFGNPIASSLDDIAITYAIDPTQYNVDGTLVAALQGIQNKTFTANLFLNKNILDTDIANTSNIKIAFNDNQFGTTTTAFAANGNNILELVLRPNSAGAAGAVTDTKTIGINNFVTAINATTDTKAALVFDGKNDKDIISDTNFAVEGLYLNQGAAKLLFDSIMIQNNANVTIKPNAGTNKDVIMSKAITVDGGYSMDKTSLASNNYDSASSNLRDAPVILKNGEISITQDFIDVTEAMLVIKRLVSSIPDYSQTTNKLNLTKKSLTGQFLAVDDKIDLKNTDFTFTADNVQANIIAKNEITFDQGVKGKYDLKLSQDTDLFTVADFTLSSGNNLTIGNIKDTGAISFNGADITFNADLNGHNFSLNNATNELKLNGIDKDNKTKLTFNLSSSADAAATGLNVALLNIKAIGAATSTETKNANLILDFTGNSQFNNYSFTAFKSSVVDNKADNLDFTIKNNPKTVNLFETSVTNASLTLSESKITHHIKDAASSTNLDLPNLIGNGYDSSKQEFTAGSKTVSYIPFIQNNTGGENGLNIASAKNAHIIISPIAKTNITDFKLKNVLTLGGSKDSKITIEEPKKGTLTSGEIVIDTSTVKISSSTNVFVLQPSSTNLVNNLSLYIQTQNAGNGAINSIFDISQIATGETAKLKIDEIKTDFDKLNISLQDTSGDGASAIMNKTIELQYSGTNLGIIKTAPRGIKNVIAANADHIRDGGQISVVTLKSTPSTSKDFSINKIDLVASAVKFDSSIKTLKIGDVQSTNMFKIGTGSLVDGPINFEFDFNQVALDNNNFKIADLDDNGNKCTLSLSPKTKNTTAINLDDLNFGNSTVSLTNVLATISARTKIKNLALGTDSEISISSPAIQNIKKITQLNNDAKKVKIKTLTSNATTTLTNMEINLLNRDNTLETDFNMIESDQEVKFRGKSKLAIDAVKVKDFDYDLSNSDARLEVGRFMPFDNNSTLTISGLNGSNTNISISMLPAEPTSYQTITLSKLGEDMLKDKFDVNNGVQLTNMKSDQIDIKDSHISHYSNNDIDDITFENSVIALGKSDHIQGTNIKFIGSSGKNNMIILKDGETNSTDTTSPLISGPTTISGGNLGLVLLGQSIKSNLQSTLQDLKICVAAGDLTKLIVPFAINSPYKNYGTMILEQNYTFVSFSVDHAKTEAATEAANDNLIKDIITKSDAADLKNLIEISNLMSNDWISTKNSANISEDLAKAINEEIKILRGKNESELSNSEALLLKNLDENYNVDSRVKFLQNFFAYKSNSANNESNPNNINQSTKDTLETFADNISNSSEAIDSAENFESLVVASNEAVDGDNNERGNIVSSASDSGRDSMNFKFGKFGINIMGGFKDTDARKANIKAISGGLKAQINRVRLGINIKYASLDVTYNGSSDKTNKMTMPEFGVDVGFVGIESNKNLLLVGGKFTATKISGTIEDIKIASSATKLGQTVKVKGDYSGTKLEGCLYAQYVAALSGEIGGKDSISFGIYGQIGVRKGWIDAFQLNGGGPLENLKYSETNMLSVPVLAMASLTVKKGDFSITPMIGASIDLKSDITDGKGTFLIDDLGAQSTTTSKSFFRGLVGLSASVNVGSVKIKGGYMANINPNVVYNIGDGKNSPSTNETKTETTHTFNAGVEFSF